MSRLDEKFVKEYFGKRGTVSKWWDPEGKSAYTVYDRHYFKREKEDIVKILQPLNGKHILEVGTGKGRIAIELAKCSAEVTAIDISKEMLEIASERAREQGVENRTTFEEGDAESLRYSNNVFDAVVCVQTLMHIPNQLKCLKELTRVTKLKGIILIDHINKEHLWRVQVRGKKNFIRAILVDIYLSDLSLPIRYLIHKTLKKPINPSTVSRTTRTDFCNLVQESGLKIEHTVDYGPKYCPIYFLIVAKKELI